MKTLTFYSYKGGVGRSLALSNIAIRLSEYNKKVCVLDFDLEAPGLHMKFKNYNKSKEINNGIVDYIHSFSCEGKVKEKIIDYAVKLIPKNKAFSTIHLIPAGNIDDNEYWKKLSTIDWFNMFYDEKSQGIEFFLNIKAKIEKEIAPDILLIDSRTGITDISGISLRLLADEIVVLAANNEENIYGSKKIIKSLLDPNNSLFNRTPKINFILTRLPFTDAPKDREKEFATIKKLELEFKTYLQVDKFDISIIHSDRRLEENERHLIGYEYEGKEVSIANDYLNLFDKLTSDILKPDEVKRFHDEKRAQKEFDKAIYENDNTKKIEHLDKAIELDQTKFTYFLNRGLAYYNLKNNKKSFEDFTKAIELNPDSAYLNFVMGYFYNEQEKIEEAVKYLDKAIGLDSNYLAPYSKKVEIYTRKLNKINESLQMLNHVLENISPNDPEMLNARANMYRRTGEIEKAYVDIYKAIELNPESPVYFGTLAEIYATDSKVEEFYLNLNIALSKKINLPSLKSEIEVYEPFKDDVRFISLLNKYNIDIEEFFN